MFGVSRLHPSVDGFNVGEQLCVAANRAGALTIPAIIYYNDIIAANNEIGRLLHPNSANYGRCRGNRG